MPYPEIVRERIRASEVLGRLITHVTERPCLNASQVNAALGLLRKVAPDLKQTEITTAPDQEPPKFIMVLANSGED